jgi:hypothetical protein
MIEGARATVPRATVQPESEASLARRTIASVTIQPEDRRPFVLRRWSATVMAGDWAPDEPPFGKYYWRARSKERLVAKATRRLRRQALSMGIDRPVIVVTDLASPVKVWIPAC